MAPMAGTVLVTGASTGIGEATALHLKELGFDSVGRRAQGRGRASGCGSLGLRTVKLDVTDQASIAAARDELGDGPLAGLVNNAGIAVAGPLEFLPLDQLRLQLEINLVGQVAVTQQFLPALRAGGGRIVNVELDRGPLRAAARRALQRLQVRARGDQRLAAARAARPGRRRDPDRARRRQDADLEEEQRGWPTRSSSSMPPEAERLYGTMIEALRRATVEIAQENGHRAARGGRGDRQGADRQAAAHALPGRHRREDPRADREGPARPADGPRRSRASCG